MICTRVHASMYTSPPNAPIPQTDEIGTNPVLTPIVNDIHGGRRKSCLDEDALEYYLLLISENCILNH